MPLSYDAVNQIVKTSVTFTYRNYVLLQHGTF